MTPTLKRLVEKWRERAELLRGPAAAVYTICATELETALAEED